MNTDMKLLLADYGFNYSNLGRELGISPQAVRSWYENKSIPAKSAVLIEKMTEGKYKAINLTGE